MADTNFKPSRKPYVYDLLGQLNGAFARVTAKLSTLEQVGIFEIRTMRRLYWMSKELQSDANVHLLETLRDAEEKDWARFGRAQRGRGEKR